MTENSDPFVVVDDSLCAALGESRLRIVPLGAWAQDLATTGPGDVAATRLPLGFLLTEDSLADPALRDLVTALHCPRHICAGEPGTALIDLLAEASATTARSAADLRAALAALRREHAAMQTRFGRFEDFVYDALAPKYIIAQTWHATEGAVALSPGQTLVQMLPVSSSAFAALDVCVVGAGPDAPDLTLTLSRPSGGALAEPVTMALAADYRGWARFHLGRALDGFAHDIVATLTTTAPISLTIAPPSPVARYRLRHDDAEQAGPLALRVFKGLPGAQLPDTHPPRIAPPLDPLPRLYTAYDMTPAKLLPSSPDMIVEEDAADYFACEYWGNENAFLVHPSVHFPVVAVAEDLAATRMIRLAASIQIARQDCDTIAFAIGAAPAGTVTNSEQALDHLGPWQVLRPGEWGSCEMMPQAPITGRYDLFMATSMEGHPSNENAWALFRDFRITNSEDAA